MFLQSAMYKNILFVAIILSAGTSIGMVSFDQPIVIGQSNTTNTTNSNTTVGPMGLHSQCDPSYPDTCISPPPPDLNCDDISDKKFAVISPDPHGFDRDSDGIGCES